MKRFISALLAVVMVLSMITVSAVAWTAPATFENTSDLYDTDAPTLYAVKGTPTIDGTVDAAWANAYTLRIDNSTRAMLGGTIAQSTMADIYMMWDENNLYILEDHQFASPMYNADEVNFLGKSSASCFYLSLPTPYTDDENALNDGGTNMINIMVGDTSTNSVAAGHVTKRVKAYKGNDGVSFTDVPFAANTEVITYTNKIDANNYIQETAIPWSVLDDYTPNFTVAKDTIIGMILHMKSNWGSNGMHKASTDTNGFQQLKLVEGTNPTVKPILADWSWYDASATEYTITTAAQLLALVELTNSDGSSPFAASVGVSATDALKNKTIKLGANIDLNPGTTFNADGTWTGNVPVSGWGGISRIDGSTFDGQGYTISGMYSKGQGSGQHANEFGFINRLTTGSTIKNLKLANGVLCGDSADVVGSIAGVVHGNGISGSINVTNVESGVHVVCNNSQTSNNFSGGLFGSAYTGGTAVVYAYFTNVTYTGTVSTTKSTALVGTIAGRSTWGTAGASQSVALVFDNVSVAESAGIPLIGTGNLPSYQYTAKTDAAKIQSTTAANNVFDVRILGLIDEADLDAAESVGMSITVTVAEKVESVYGGFTTKTTNFEPETTSTTTVYTTVNANGAKVTAESLGGDYAYGAVLTNLPAGTDTTVTITVKLLRTDANGTVYSSNLTYTATYVAGALQVAE